MLARFEHLSDTLFVNTESDTGEKELDHILQVDHDLDTFYAAVGLIKSTLDAALADEGNIYIIRSGIMLTLRAYRCRN
jgi:hypothetical protein